MELGFAGPNQAHTVLTTGDQQSLQVQLLHQRLGFIHELLFRLAASDNSLKLVKIRRKQGRAPVAPEVTALGVNQHRNALFVCRLNQRLWVLQGAFGIV